MTWSEKPIVLEKGTRFGRLTVLSLAKKRGPGRYYRCLCDCENKIVVPAFRLRNGHIKSCGCLKPLGSTMTPEYIVWMSLKRRCRDPKMVGYEHYGGRGIKVCKRWLKSFQNFLEDMGPRPSSKYTIDRQDPDGDYEPKNCHWATSKQQAKNKRKK